MLLKGLTFDDVLLQPQFSDLASRSEADISTTLGTSILLKHPIVSANMDSVTEVDMAKALDLSGSVGFLHRYADKETVVGWLKGCPTAIPSVGVQDLDKELATTYREFTDRICLDVAHGDHISVVKMLQFLKTLNFVDVVAGNVATGGGAGRLIEAGATVIKVGVGNGSNCITRLVSGHGVPQLQAIEEVAAVIKTVNEPIGMIADGGIRFGGDIVKALAAGADAVMVGGLLADTFESPAAKIGEHRGMASKNAQEKHRGKVHNGAPEGVSRPLKTLRPVADVLTELCGGVRSGLSYSGAHNLTELQKNAVFIKITSNGLTESHPHGLLK